MRILLLLLLSTPVIAGGPKWAYRDNPKLDDEISNIYHDIRSISNTTSSTSGSSITVSGITASSATIGNLYGTTTNSNACAGCVGEYKESVVIAQALTQNQFANITSVSLTPGDWNVTGIARFEYNTNQSNTLFLAVSIYSGNTTTDHVYGSNALEGPPSTSAYNTSQTISNYRMSISANTTVYLKGYITNTATTASGRISAWRMR